MTFLRQSVQFYAIPHGVAGTRATIRCSLPTFYLYLAPPVPLRAYADPIADPKSFKHGFYNNFNTSAFTLAPVGTFGNIGLGILRQPAWSNWDMTLDKRIQIGKSEKRVLRLRLEAYNVFNHTEFSSIGAGLTLLGSTNTNTQYGQYTGTQSPRQMSTTVRFEF